MVRHGQEPFLECSTAGDSRFSALCARLRSHGNGSIEEIYQGAKRFEDGTTGLHWQAAKAKSRHCRVTNLEQVRTLYASLWDDYLSENPYLLKVLVAATGLSDKFGQAGHACQATELWRIREGIVGIAPAAPITEPAQRSLLF